MLHEETKSLFSLPLFSPLLCFLSPFISHLSCISLSLLTSSPLTLLSLFCPPFLSFSSLSLSSLFLSSSPSLFYLFSPFHLSLSVKILLNKLSFQLFLACLNDILYNIVLDNCGLLILHLFFKAATNYFKKLSLITSSTY